MPKERYAAYHAERAKAGVALAMTAGSAAVSKDSPPVFNNILAYRDEVVPWIRKLTDACHDHGCAVMIPADAPWSPHGVEQGGVAALGVVFEAPRTGAPGLPETGRGLGHRTHHHRFRRCDRAHEGGRHGRDRVAGLRPPARSVLVAADQRPRRPLRRPDAGHADATTNGCAGRHPQAGGRRLHRRAALHGGRGGGGRHHRRGRHRDFQASRRLGHGRFPQRGAGAVSTATRR